MNEFFDIFNRMLYFAMWCSGHRSFAYLPVAASTMASESRELMEMNAVLQRLYQQGRMGQVCYM